MNNAAYIQIHATLENDTLASKVATELVRQRLAACVQLKPIKSYYLWDNQLCCSEEIELSIKTLSGHFENIAALIRQSSSYEITQIIATPIIQGDETYLQWIEDISAR